MKNTLFIFMTACALNTWAQSTIQLSNFATSAVIAPNATINITTAANTNTQVTFNVKNTSNSTQQYNAKRYDMVLNTANSTTAVAYFCFAGTCYGDNVLISPTSLTLTAGQSADQVPGSYQMLVADLDEAAAPGFSHVRYTFININNSADSIQVNVKYNSTPGPVGLKQESAKSGLTLGVYPNPAKEVANIQVNVSKPSEGMMMIYNALGEIVYQKTTTLSEGTNSIALNVSSYPAGVYFAAIKTGDTSLTKKFIID